MQPQEVNALIAAAANAIYTRCSPEETAALSILLVQLGTTLATLTALGSSQSESSGNSTASQQGRGGGS